MDAEQIAREEAAVAGMLHTHPGLDLTNHRWALELEPGVWVVTEKDGSWHVADVPAGG